MKFVLILAALLLPGAAAWANGDYSDSDSGGLANGAVMMLRTAKGVASPVTSTRPAPVMPPAIAPANSTAVEASHVMCAAACSLISITVNSSSASATQLMLFDATSDPADGAVTPKYCWNVAAGNWVSFQWQNPAAFATGLVAVLSSGGGCTTKAETASGYFTAQVL